MGRLFRSLETAALALTVAVGCLVVAHILTPILDIFRGRLAAWLTFRMVADIRGQIYERLHGLSLRFFDKRKTGTVISHITEDSTRLQWFLLDGLQFLVIDLLMLFGIGAFPIFNELEVGVLYPHSNPVGSPWREVVLEEGSWALASGMAAKIEDVRHCERLSLRYPCCSSVRSAEE